jgi:Fe-S-cluster-containing hydrogenase component 2/CRP-like cAMP-binding protein
VFNLIQKDDGYRQRILDLYRQRLLSSHLQHLKFLEHASEEHVRWLSERVEMKFVDAGTVICNEGEPSDCVYVIKAGLVQVVKGVKGLRAALDVEDVRDWRAFARELLKGDPGIRIPCPECSNELRLPDKSLLGRRGKCPTCGHKFVLVEARDESQTPPPDPQKSMMNSLKRLAASRPAPSGAQRPGPGRPGTGPQKPQKREPTPKETIWNELPVPVQQAIRRLAAGVASGPPVVGDAPSGRPPVLPTPVAPPAAPAAGEPPAAADQFLVLVALNDLIKSREFVNSKSLAAVLKNEPRIAGYPRNKKQWTGPQVCVAGRLLLQAVCPEHLRPPAEAGDDGPPRILAYLSSGDVFGETGVVLHRPRGATCIAYDHPSDDSTRTPGQVELVVIRGEHFDQLLAESPDLRHHVEETIERYRQNEERDASRPVWSRSNSILTSSEFQDRGFIQGRKLMLIDLDACTRCGDCVRACINTHDDGYSRLYLDGPRFDRFLVPSACRNCIDPACMIGCPVGSIQKGENGQIVIRDWCIGCNTCARQCPYDSIQMHDTGLVPEPSRAWRYIRAADVANRAWYRRRFNDSRWAETDAPVLWDLDFQAGLQGAGRSGRPASGPHGNGRQAARTPADPAESSGSSALAYRDKILSVRLDVDRKPPMPPGMEESDVQVRLKVLPAIAVVCDQCSTLPGQEPACVTQCPHEAAMRVEARFEFPIGMGGG